MFPVRLFRFLICSQLRKYLSSSQKVPKALCESPTITHLFSGPCPIFSPWPALPPSLFAPLPSFLFLLLTNLVDQHIHSKYNLLQLWEIVFQVLLYHPFNPSVAEFHTKPCYPCCCSPDILQISIRQP